MNLNILQILNKRMKDGDTGVASLKDGDQLISDVTSLLHTSSFILINHLK